MCDITYQGLNLSEQRFKLLSISTCTRLSLVNNSMLYD